MAYEIPSDFVLPSGRLLVQADEDDDACIGTIIRIGTDENWGCFARAFRTTLLDNTKIRKTIQDPDYVPSDPENPPYESPGHIHTDYTRIIFNRLTAQEVKVDNVDYFIIHVIDILGLIPPE